MGFPLNQLKLDSSYINAVEDEAERRILAQYTAFKRGSAALVYAFTQEVDKYGSINNTPIEILQKFSSPFQSMLEISKNLREDLRRQVNKNTKDLELIRINGDENSFINEIALRKREKLNGKIGYFDTIQALYIAIDSTIVANAL